MEYWRSFELSPKTLRQIVDHFHVIKKILDDKEKSSLFFNHFPYEQLFNFTTTDGQNVILCAKILDLFTNYEEFCNCNERINYALEFILLGLSHVNRDCREIMVLVQLLSKILDKNINSIDSSFKNVFDRERILELLLKLANFKSVIKSNFMFYSLILARLVDSNFSDSSNHLISGLFDKFTQHNMVKEQIVVCRLILRCHSKIFSEFFKNVWNWLVTGCPTILTQSNETSLLEDAIYCLLKFIKIWSEKRSTDKRIGYMLFQRIRDLHENLSKVASHICLHTERPQLKSDCYQLLKFILSLFVNSENVIDFSQNDILDGIEHLAEDVEKWPKSDIDLFFCICHICVSNNNLLWKKSDVLFAIMRCFYNRRHIIKPFVLKSIYYLYPILTRDIDVDLDIRILGDDLLNYFTKLCSISYLYSYNVDQLKWMLNRAPTFAKLTVLTHWMTAVENDDSLEEQLTSTIENCQAQKLLLKLMLDNKNLGTKIGIKSAMLLRKIQNDDVSSIITSYLPFTMDKPLSMYNLLLTEPNISVDSFQSIQICSLMGVVIATVTDAQMLRSACIFSSKLLSRHKNDPRALQGFCKNVSNIRHIIYVSEKVNDETGVEIIRLLKTLILIQQRNKFKLDYSLKEDFRLFIKGSTEKIMKSLWLLYHCLVYKHALITLDLRNVIEIYHLLLDFSLNSLYQDLAYRCIITLLKRIPWLAQTVSSSVYIEMVCLSFSDATFKQNVFKMLDVWLALIKQEMYNGFCPIPETAIRSFIMRGAIKKTKMQEYLKILEDLLKRQNRDAKRNIFLAIK